MNQLLHSIWMERLGWALLHSLWQGAVLWMVLSCVLISNRGMPARRKHHLACATMLLFVLCPVLTTAWLGRDGTPRTVAVVTAPSKALQSTQTVIPSPQSGSISPVVQPTTKLESLPPLTPPGGHILEASSMRPALPWLVFAWIAGVAFLTLRLLSGFLWLASLRRHAAPLQARWHENVRELCRRYSLPSPVVQTVSHLGIPMVVGWLKPIIYLPAAMLSSLSTAEVEAVLLHEMAHLKRRDPAWQLVITIVETLLFYHPATHAMASLARDSAEQACDDMVLSWTHDGKTYARALAALEEARGPRLALAASASPLRQRLRRILGQSTFAAPTRIPLRLGMTGVAAVGGFLFVSLIGVPRLAQALTHEERVSVIEKKRAEVTSGTVLPDKSGVQTRSLGPVAIGQIHLPEGSAAPKLYRLGTYPPEDTEQKKGQGLTRVRAEIHPLKETWIGVWAEGYAPAQTKATPLDATTHEAKFDLTLETGHPISLKIVDEQGQPISGAQVHAATTWKSGLKVDRAGDHLVTNAEGFVDLGRAVPENRFEVDVLAAGYQWQSFAELNSVGDKPIVLSLKRAHVIPVEVVNAVTGKPVAGCRTWAYYGTKRHFHGRWYTEYPVTEYKPAFSAPSDAAGHLELTSCDPEDETTVTLIAQGYQRIQTVVTGSTASLHIELEPAIRLAGHIHDPDRIINREERHSMMLVGWMPAKNYHMTTSLECPDIPEGIPFDLDNVAPGKVYLTVQNHRWEATLDKSLTNLELLVTKDGMMVVGPPEMLPATHRVEVQFDLPPGAPPINGELRVETRVGHPLMKVVNNRGTIDVAVPGKLDILPGGLSGWAFAHHQFDVDSKDEPKMFHVPCTPGGAISGLIDLAPIEATLEKIKAEEGVDPYFSVALVSDEGIPSPDGTFKIHYFDSNMVEVLENPRRYFASGLHLPGKYRIRVQYGNFFAQSDILQLDEAHPIAQANVQFREGREISGQILLPDGSPFMEKEVTARYNEETLRATLTVQKMEGGRFKIRGLNFAMPGRYLLYVADARGLAPLVAELKESSPEMNVKLQPGLPLDVVLLDAHNQPVSGMKLAANASGSGSSSDLADAGAFHADAASDAQGRVHFSSLPSCILHLRADSSWVLDLEEDKTKMLDSTVIDMSHKSSQPFRLRVKKH